VAGRRIREELTHAAADVICLTEASRELLPSGGEVVEAEPNYGYVSKPTRRKVILWSRSGFAESSNQSPSGMPSGRFAAGVIKATRVHVVGVCIPWSMAHVSTGRRDRAPWEDHVTYLEALRSYLQGLNGRHVLVVGDFNQTVPRSRAPLRVYESLLRTFEGLDILTANRPAPRPLLDHMAATPGVTFAKLAYLPELTDHVGWSANVHVV